VTVHRDGQGPGPGGSSLSSPAAGGQEAPRAGHRAARPSPLPAVPAQPLAGLSGRAAPPAWRPGRTGRPGPVSLPPPGHCLDESDAEVGPAGQRVRTTVAQAAGCEQLEPESAPSRRPPDSDARQWLRCQMRPHPSRHNGGPGHWFQMLGFNRLRAYS
jgi:hypothetical protein